jgi:ERCC4-type nuclease
MASTLIIDVREHALHNALSQPHEMRQLHVGDIHIGNSDKPALVLERKTFADFEASIMDQRYREQRGRLLAFGSETGARIGYILEGNNSSQGLQTIGDSLFVKAVPQKSRISHAAIMKMVSRLMYRHGIPVFRTLSVVDTAELVQNLHQQWTDDNEVFNSDTTAQRATDGIQVVKKNNAEDPKIFGISMLCLVTGVSPRIAEAWLAACGSAGEVLQAPMKTLADVKVGSRRVGDAVATRAVSMWTAAGLRSL